MRTIQVVPYHPEWKSEFQKASDFYRDLLQDIDVEIEHVGSTSVEGLWAKPILDIDIVVQNQEDCDRVIEHLKGIDYHHVGDCGIPGREVLQYEEDNPHISWMEHHLYVCLAGRESLINHLLLRKHLRENPSSVEAYSRIKHKLAQAHPHDIDAYIEGKTALIARFLEKEGMDLDALNRITDLNKKK
jgi:GrpB-like predicted nucleotidyltransferase (UPF0157 family)